MKILIQTNFSKLSKAAVHDPVKMAKKLNAEIVSLNVIFMSTSPRAILAVKFRALGELMVYNAKQDSIELIKEIKSENRSELNISYEITKVHTVE